MEDMLLCLAWFINIKIAVEYVIVFYTMQWK